MEIEKLISIHAPRVRGDLTPSNFSQETKDFNPRPSCEGRLSKQDNKPDGEISIHAPRVRGDLPVACRA